MNWSQLRAILWLQQRLRMRRFARGGNANRAAFVFLTLFSIAGLAIAAFAGFFLGRSLAKDPSPALVLFAVDGVVAVFLFSWIVGILSDFQLSDVFDPQRFLHFPTSLKELFLINYAAGWWASSIFLLTSFSTGAAIGAVSATKWIFLWMLPMGLGCLFMLTAWTQCLRGWIQRKMQNPRRRKAILAWMGLAVVLIAQTPNLYFNAFGGRTRGIKPSSTLSKNALAVHAAIPAGWPALAAWGLRQGNPVPAGLVLAASVLAGTLGIRIAYGIMQRTYMGTESNPDHPMPAAVAPPVSTTSRTPGLSGSVSTWMHRTIPGVPHDVGHMTWGWLRAWSRATEVRMMFGGMLVLAIFFGAALLRQSVAKELANAFLPASITAVLGFGFAQFFNNNFAYDRHGFRSVLLSPINRKQLILTRNLAVLGMSFSMGWLMLTLAWAFRRLDWIQWIFGTLQMTSAIILTMVLGNFLSIGLPYALPEGGWRKSRPPTLVILLNFLSVIPVGLIALSVSIPSLAALWWRTAGKAGSAWVLGIGSCFVLTASVILYILLVDFTGEWLERREQRLLQVITKEEA